MKPEKTPRPLVFALFIAVMAAAVYWPVVKYPFIHFDDVLYVAQNETIQKGLTLDGLRTAFTKPGPGGWPHPLALVSHMLDCQIYGLKAGGHHATNTLLHTAGAIFLFLALLEMTADPWRSAFVAAVFALHPLQVESVAWVSERKNVLNGFFFMLTLWSYAWCVKEKNPGRYALVAAFFVLSLMSRSVMIALPLILLLLDFWPLKRKEDWKELVREKGFMLGLSAVCALVALKTAVAVSPLDRVPAGARMANAAFALANYLKLAVWPSELCVYYPFDYHIAAWKIAGSLVFIIAASFFVFRNRGGKPWLFVGWLWFLLCLAPFIGVVQVGPQAHADRYMYLPLVGLAIAAAWSVPDKIDERVAALAGAGIVIAMMIATSLQLRYWQDDSSVFMRALRFHPESAAVHANLGAAFYGEGDMGDAISEYQDAIRIDPSRPETHNNLGIAWIAGGEPDRAVAELKKALALDPADEHAKHNLEKAEKLLAEKKAKAARLPPPRPSRRPRK